LAHVDAVEANGSPVQLRSKAKAHSIDLYLNVDRVFKDWLLRYIPDRRIDARAAGKQLMECLEGPSQSALGIGHRNPGTVLVELIPYRVDTPNRELLRHG
jgi:hypothetical protein